MATEIKKNNYYHKRTTRRIVLLGVYLIILLILYFYLVQLGFNPIIIIFLLSFLFLITIGLFLKRFKGTLYSRLFPDRKRGSSINSHTRKTKVIREKDDEKMQTKIPKHFDLNVSYRKPLIKKCDGCGNILPNFVKKCPFCNKPIT